MAGYEVDRKNQEEVVTFKLTPKGGRAEGAFQVVKSAYVKALQRPGLPEGPYGVLSGDSTVTPGDAGRAVSD